MAIAVFLAPDSAWMTEYFSVLGANGGSAGVVFAVTLATTGALIGAYGVVVGHEARPRPVWFEVSTVTLGVLVALLGLVPLSVSKLAHEAAAVAVIPAFAGMVISSAVYWPAVRSLAVKLLAALSIMVLLHFCGVGNLTAYEFGVFVLVGVFLTGAPARFKSHGAADPAARWRAPRGLVDHHAVA